MTLLLLILPMLPPVEMPAQLDTEQARYVLEVSGWHVDDIPGALTIMQCESGMNSKALGDGSFAEGLFQIHGRCVDCIDGVWEGWQKWLVSVTGRSFDLLDPYDNAYAALLVFRRSGWGVWSCKP